MSTQSTKVSKDHPLFFHKLLGGSSWKPNGKSEAVRLYFNNYNYRGWEWWNTLNAKEMLDYEQINANWHGSNLTLEHYQSGMPKGFFDIEKGSFFVADPNSRWTHKDYDLFMNRALKRRTLAPTFARKEVLTSNGKITHPGLVCLLIGGKISNHPDWNFKSNIGMRVIVMNRYANWYFSENGKQTTYGDAGLKLREYGCCIKPSAFWICPEEEGREFIIEGRNIDITRPTLLIENPLDSLIALDDDGTKTINKIMLDGDYLKKLEDKSDNGFKYSKI